MLYGTCWNRMKAVATSKNVELILFLDINNIWWDFYHELLNGKWRPSHSMLVIWECKQLLCNWIQCCLLLDTYISEIISMKFFGKILTFQFISIGYYDINAFYGSKRHKTSMIILIIINTHMRARMSTPMQTINLPWM